MPRRLLTLVFLPPLLASCLHGPPTPLGVPGRGHASYAIGWKGKDSTWRGAEDEFVFGVVDFDTRLPRYPVWLVGKTLIGTSGNEPDYVDDRDADSSSTAEFDLGLRKYTQIGPLESFVSGGVALLWGSIWGREGDRDNYYYTEDIDTAATVGGWVDTGFHLPVNPYWGVGVVVHYSAGPDARLEGEDVQLGGLSVLFTIGGRW